jgi:AmmeMemoRadiSam system radical SAM enzyme/AmmeMemoRadiSam system protein B/AmmeMemoRadiSam system protein A
MPEVIVLPPEDAGSKGVRAAGWWRQSEQDGGRAVCGLCPRACELRPGDRGFCLVRENRDGRMVSTTYGRGTGFCLDPIEKKPLHHFYPGTAVLSFGTAGCNLNCKFCQNWTMSRAREVDSAGQIADPKSIASSAKQLGCRSVAFTYNEPVVWAEYCIDTAKACRELGIKTVAVTSGYINPAARETFFAAMDAANVDLKAFSEDFYERMTSGRLQPVLDTLRWAARESGTWLEITNLLIPEENDSADELKRMCDWIARELGPDVPLHFSAFHPDFKMTDRPPTPPETLHLAHDLARAAGLNYVYTGNVADREHQATYCPGCNRPVIERDGYELNAWHLSNGCCARCGRQIAGRFDNMPGDWGGKRQPVRIAPLTSAPPTSTPLTSTVVEDRPLLDDRQQSLVFRAAGKQVAATAMSQRLRFADEIPPEAAALPVYGAFVSLKRGGQLRSCCGYLGESVKLAEAVERAAIRAAKDDPRFPPISSYELDQLDMEVWLLWGLRPIGARGEDRASAIVIGKHGLQIARGNARGLLLPGVAVEHNLDARNFLRQVCLKAGLPQEAWKSDDTAVSIFEGYAIEGRLGLEISGAAGPPALYTQEFVSMAQWPRIEEPADVRPAAVAGTFYPGRREQMDLMLDELLPDRTAAEPWAGAMVPHAGWTYSGRLAAAVFSRVKFPSRVIVLCPKHRPGGAQWAVAPHRRWALPGGEVQSDFELAQRLAGAVAGLQLDETAHRQEHAVEVQLPFIARLAPEALVVGIAIGGGELAGLRQFGRQLAGEIGRLPERPLLVVSSDMNHFAGDAETRRLDRLALDAIETLDPERLYETVRENRISMCGMLPTVVALEALQQLGCLSRCELVGYATSGDTTGETNRVVGYAGMLFG